MSFTDELLKICRHVGAFEKGAVCCGSVTVPQCLVLQELLEGARDMGSLSSHTGSTISAMTRLVDGLAARGFVERRRDADDGRRVLVALTKAGRAEGKSLRAATEAMVGALLERIPKGKRRQVLDSMRIVREAMDTMVSMLGPS